ncbi:MAG TPA: bifunctional adenosylcobinamide kinase/adenosylcobinamide-phosphate guanylyltransferase [Noviherbaspirillum sp.]|jgi:adenosylcobinamide kinase/adenosylcobinamide-phosphate guanylyltransferase|uniref:bifunctional adenosylcobinamide kinase/adenosylcobinamide-phosphate guanylyltransferase n=1 Tax=Noviherbaspirillum sp. TaxID=1926288 RepID=UPI002F9461CB
MTRVLILGGARSGKSAYAERIAGMSGKAVVYIATAAAGDSEMAARVAEHRRRRDACWTTVEEPLALGKAIERHCRPGTVVLVDCLTVWLSNLLFSDGTEYPDVGRVEPPPAFGLQRERLLRAVAQAQGELVLVSNEVGLGIVPLGAASRWFVDEAGRLNQALAAVCDQVVFVAAGLPMALKGGPC